MIRKIKNAFVLSFDGSYFLAIVAIIALYYSLPASDAAKTSWFPIILFDPFVMTVAFFVSSCFGLLVFFFSSFLCLLRRNYGDDQHHGRTAR